MRSTTPGRGLAALTILLTLAATGCASASDTYEARNAAVDNGRFGDIDLMSRIEAATDDVHSVYMTISLENADTHVRANLRVDLDTGNLASVSRDGEVRTEITRIGTDIYLRAGRDFWQMTSLAGNPDLLDRLEGRWARLDRNDPARGPLAGKGAAFDFEDFVARFYPTEQLPDEAIHGRPMIVRGQTRNDEHVLVHIPRHGSPRPARVVVTTDGGAGGIMTIDLTDYNRRPDLSAPPRSQVVDIPVLSIRR